MVLEAIRYTPGTLTILDQLLLPHRESWEPITTAEEAWTAIQTMKVRGAPAIAIVAALSVAVEQHALLSTLSASTAPTSHAASITSRLNYLLTSRPTAVNLGDAVRKLSSVVDDASTSPSASASSVAQAYIASAEQMLIDDVADNEAIGAAGASWILAQATGGAADKVAVMTHCNTGSLATAGYGTALGIVRSLHAGGRLARTFYGETRPYNQGSRLTGYELLHDRIPATLLTDSMAGALMAQRGPRGSAWDATPEHDRQPLVAVIVGADRVAANGDTANKIGTYALAVLARFHGVKFVVAAPRTTVDLRTASGSEIVIEERKQREVTAVKGPTVVKGPDGKDTVDLDDAREVSIAPTDTTAWNPAFDVTPAELIDAIVTEVGVAVKDDQGRFQLDKLFAEGVGRK